MINLPLVCMGREVGRKIGATVGVVEEVDTDADGVGWGEFLRVRISIDLSKPLSRGRMINLQGESTWITFQYESYRNTASNVGSSNMEGEDAKRGAFYVTVRRMPSLVRV